MKLLKKPFKRLKKGLPGLLSLVLYLGLRVLFATMRVHCLGTEKLQRFHREKQGIVIASWHSMILLTTFPYRGDDLHILISRHGDGELISRVVKLFGYSSVRGSSSKGGKAALRELVLLLRQNKDVAITPDGPRGPAEVVKPGIAQLARLSGAPVFPAAMSASRLKILKTWDRFRIPCPFSKIVYVIGDPLYYREGEDFEALRKRIETGIKDATEKADAYFRT